MNEEQLTYYLYFAALLFSSGVFVILTKRSAIFILIGVELMLNGANVIFAAFSQFDPHLSGQVFAILAIILTVCEVAIALAILLNIYRKSQASNLDELTEVGN